MRKKPQDFWSLWFRLFFDGVYRIYPISSTYSVIYYEQHQGRLDKRAEKVYRSTKELAFVNLYRPYSSVTDSSLFELLNGFSDHERKRSNFSQVDMLNSFQ
jgi:hypothetical protein